jgi:site-specific recombinase XerC
MNWAIYKKGFKAFLQLEKSLSAHSVEAYLRDMDKLTNYFESIGKEVSPSDIHLRIYKVLFNALEKWKWLPLHRQE